MTQLVSTFLTTPPNKDTKLYGNKINFDEKVGKDLKTKQNKKGKIKFT